MKKILMVMLFAAMLMLPAFAKDTAKTPAEIARFSFEAMQKKDLKALLPYTTGSSKTGLEAITNMLDAVDRKDLKEVVKYTLMASGRASDEKTVANMVTVIKMQNQENMLYSEARKKIEANFVKYKDAVLGEIKENIEGNYATAVTNYTLKDGTAKSETAHFKKIEGKWFAISPADLPKKTP